jgi:anti-sigma factor RsiW
VITCREFVEFLEEYRTKALPAERRSIFEEHLAICPWCVAYLETYGETIRLGKGAFADPDAPVPEEVPEKLVQAILEARRGRK